MTRPDASGLGDLGPCGFCGGHAGAFFATAVRETGRTDGRVRLRPFCASGRVRTRPIWRVRLPKRCKRRLPLSLAWAITIHKSQGATYDKAIVNIGEKEFHLGLTYVAFSRVRSLDGLLLRGCYGMDRIMRINLHRKQQLREDAESWLDTLLQSMPH